VTEKGSPGDLGVTGEGWPGDLCATGKETRTGDQGKQGRPEGRYGYLGRAPWNLLGA
jgi:hypothetical protein